MIHFIRGVVGAATLLAIAYFIGHGADWALDQGIMTDTDFEQLRRLGVVASLSIGFLGTLITSWVGGLIGTPEIPTSL